MNPSSPKYGVLLHPVLFAFCFPSDTADVLQYNWANVACDVARSSTSSHTMVRAQQFLPTFPPLPAQIQLSANNSARVNWHNKCRECARHLESIADEKRGRLQPEMLLEVSAHVDCLGNSFHGEKKNTLVIYMSS